MSTALLISLMLQGAAAGPEPNGAALFLESPSSLAMVRALPDAMSRRLARKPRGLDVRIACEVNAEGRLESCVVISPMPIWTGMDLWVQRVSKMFRLRAQTQDGASIEGGRIEIPMHLQIMRP